MTTPSAAGTLRAVGIVGLLLLPLPTGLWFGGRMISKSFADDVEYPFPRQDGPRS